MFPFRSDFNPTLFPPDQLVNSQGIPYSRSLLNMSPQEKQGSDASYAWIRAAQAAGRNPYAVGGTAPEPTPPPDADYGGGSAPAAPLKVASAVSRSPQTAFDLPALQQLAIKAGFSPEKAPTAAAIMMAESSGNAGAQHHTPKEDSYGLSQINGKAWGQDVAQSALDPTNAANLMFKISKGGANFSPWTTYTSGAYKQYLGDKNMLPAFGNTRLLAQLTPQGAPGADTSTMTPGGDTSGLYNAASASGGGNDITEMLPKLMAQAKSLGLVNSPSSMLANMSAGFLGGKGPASSLAGGFAGLAKSQGQDQEGGLGLLRLAMTAGLGTQAQQVHTFTALTNAGVPVSQAAAASGLQLPSSVQDVAGSDVHGDEFVKSLEPALGAQVKALAEGRMQFPNGPALKTPYWQTMLRNVAQYDPNFDAVNYNARAKTRADFTSGKSAQNVTSLNTAIGHMGTLLQNGDALSNTSYPLVNEGVNMYRSATGDPRIVSFNTAKQAVADEMTRAFRGSGGNVADIVGWEKNLNSANSPEQLHAAIKQGVDLLSSRVNAIGEQYTKGMGTTAKPLDLLTPAAKKTLQALPGGIDLIRELGGDPGEVAQPSATPTAATVGTGANTGALKSTPSGIKYRQISP